MAADAATAAEVIRAIDPLEQLPVVPSVVDYGATLRYTYSDRGRREFSYADAIHLATAVVHDDCHTLYWGDPDFAGVEEIETVLLYPGSPSTDWRKQC